MMKSHARLIGPCIVLAAFVHGVAQRPPAAGPPLVIELRAVQTVIPAGATLKVIAEFANTSRHVVICGDDCEISWEVRSSDGTVIPLKESYRHRDFGTRLLPPTVVRIAPGKTQKWDFVISDRYDLSHPDQYMLRARRKDPNASPSTSVSNPLSVTVASDAAQPPAEHSKASFSFEIDASPDIVRTGSGVLLTDLITNTTDHPIGIDNSQNQDWVEVRDAHGALLAPTAEARRERESFGKPGSPSISLAPGETKRTGAIDIGVLFDLTKPGDYTVQISRLDQETNTLVKSNVVPITVQPRFSISEARRTQPPAVSLTISTEQLTLLSRARLRVKAELKNESPDVLQSGGDCGLEIDVRDANGNPVPETAQWRNRRLLKPILRRVAVEVTPGETQKCNFDINEMYEISGAGRYSIQVKRNVKGVMVQSNVLVVTVGKEDKLDAARDGTGVGQRFSPGLGEACGCQEARTSIAHTGN